MKSISCQEGEWHPDGTLLSYAGFPATKVDISRECWVSKPNADWPGMPPLVQVKVVAGRRELESWTTLAYYGYPGAEMAIL